MDDTLQQLIQINANLTDLINLLIVIAYALLFGLGMIAGIKLASLLPY